MSSPIECEFGPVTVLGACSVNVRAQARDAFFLERLVVPNEIAGDFLVTDVKVGKNSQLISEGCLPATVFSSRAIPELLSGFDPVEMGAFVTISVTNQSREDRVFTAVMRGSRYRKPAKWLDKLATLLRGFPEKGRRRYLLGYGSTLVEAHGTAVINNQPQLDFRPDRLIVPSTIRDSFRILGLSITGQDKDQWERMNFSYLGQPFVETSRSRVAFRRPVCRESFLTVHVENVTGHPENFQAVVAGFALREQLERRWPRRKG